MSWARRYRLQGYARSAIWMPPALGIAAALLLVPVLHRLETLVGWQANFAPDSARALFGALAGATFTLVVFVSSILLLVLQVAGAQLTPRIVGLVFRDRVTVLALTLFTFTFTFTLAVLLRIGDSFVPAVTAHMAGYLCLLCVADFLYLIDHVGRSLRPSGALLAVSRMGHKVIAIVYPRRLSESPDGTTAAAITTGGAPTRIVTSPKDGVLLAFDRQGLVELARAADCIVELAPEVGDFVAAGSPLFRIHGRHDGPSAIALCRAVALGQERTMEQDPAFAFRIIVDIASKGLSRAINDPTTAVLAIDQIHHLLRSVGSRHLDEGVARDASQLPRLVYRTPNWEDFVRLAVTEIRHFGGGSIQVVRRLRAMLEHLAEILPAERSALLHRELMLLQRSADRLFAEPEDRALAPQQAQGVSEKTHRQPRRSAKQQTTADRSDRPP